MAQQVKHEMKKSVKLTLYALGLLVLIGGAIQFDKYSKHKGGSGTASSSTSGTTTAIQDVPEGTVILKMGGSSTVGDALAPALTKSFMEKNGYADVQILNTGKDEKVVVGTKDGKKEKIEISSKGTGKGFTALNTNAIDVCMASSPAPAGNSYEEHPIGLDGIAIVVNKSSTMQSINYSEIKNVFSSSGTKIYRMDENAGISKVFKEAVMGDKKISESAQQFAKSGELVAALGNDVSGISFVSYTLINKGNIRALPVSIASGMPGIVPNALTIQSEKYPLCRRLYLYSNHSPNPLTAKLVEYIESKDGQNIVNEIGFVNLNININNNTENPLIQPNDPPEYDNVVNSSSKKITTEFRFELGKENLDSRGVADILRMSQYIGQPENRSKKVILIGFTDNTGNPSKNLKLSNDRAKTVRVLLEASGIKVQKIMGFGSARPVRGNATPEDRANNHRVEVWLVD